MSQTAPHHVELNQVFDRPLQVEFDEPAQSSDGGIVLLAAVDKDMDLASRLAAALADRRQAGKVRHTVGQLLRQRVFGIACGYPDGNDVAVMGDDPLFKLACGRSLDERLGSQPTLSRFENALDARALLRLSYALCDVVVDAQRRARHRRPPRRITIDLDGVCDEVHGGQQLALFNGFYDAWCYLPLVASIAFDDEKAQYVVGAVLRGGGATHDLGAIATLKRLTPRLRAAFPTARLDFRADGAFATPEVLEWCEGQGLTYYVNLPGNQRLSAAAQPFAEEARSRFATGKKARVCGAFEYAAKTWDEDRRVVVKAEVTACEDREPRHNPRYVVTNDRRSTPRLVYARYARRGDVENRYKELRALAFDRASCTDHFANQLRYLLSVAALALYQELQRRLRTTPLARAQAPTLRERLVKLGVRVLVTTRRIVLKAPAAWAWMRWWTTAALTLRPRPA
jgi:hypothetical protein